MPSLSLSRLKSIVGGFGRRCWVNRYGILYVGLSLRLLAALATYYDPSVGFTPLISFGEQFREHRIAELQRTSVATLRGSVGYDGQFYAQLAVAGNPFRPDLGSALDSAPYRSRRILFPLLAYVFGLGRPWLVVNVYALGNIVCWIVLAVLLSRWWFPPTNLHNLLCWAGMMFNVGLLMSVTRSLTDGPALLAIALALRRNDLKRPWSAAVLAALAGLVRETSVLCACVFWPERQRGRRAALVALGCAGVCVIPVLTWVAVLAHHYGNGSAGLRNFSSPITAAWRKVHVLIAERQAHGFRSVRDEVWVVVSLAIQVSWIALHPRPKQAWWRLGAAFAVLTVCLGDAVWEGMPSAAARAVLPLTLAFNVLVPRTRSSIALIVAGNLTALSAPSIVAELPIDVTTIAKDVTLEYGEGWFAEEKLHDEHWRWSSGSAVLIIRNHRSEAVAVTLNFRSRSVLNRVLRIRTPEWNEEISLGAQKTIPVTIGPFIAKPGDAEVTLSSPQSTWLEPGETGRQLSFSAYDLTARVDTATVASGLTVEYRQGWFSEEQSHDEHWRWSSGSAAMTIHNHRSEPVAITLDFRSRSVLDRVLRIRAPGWQQEIRLAAQQMVPITVGPFVARPGETEVTMSSDEPVWSEPGANGRPLSFSAYDLVIRLAAASSTETKKPTLPSP